MYTPIVLFFSFLLTVFSGQIIAADLNSKTPLSPVVDIGVFVEKTGSSCETTIATIGFYSDDVSTVYVDGIELSALLSAANGAIRIPDTHDDNLYSFSINVCISGIHDVEFILRNGVVISRHLDFDVLSDVTIQSSDLRRDLGAKTLVIKKALNKLALMLQSDRIGQVLFWAEGLAGKNVVKIINTYRFNIANKLKELMRWESVSMEAVQDQTAGMLMGLGVKANIARSVGFIIKNLLWFVT